MGKIRVLDCTLRDGGYCNQWRFGERNIHKIIGGLMDAGIEIIECGFLTDRVQYEASVTKFTNLGEISALLPEERKGRIFVCMINYGEYSLEDIPDYDGSSVDGFRIAFHKRDMLPALELCRGLKEKGYLVFIQAMVSLNYSDEEFLDLIRSVNAFRPFAFYIVDSFGEMKKNDLVRLYYLVEHNLYKEIAIGFHSHNNMQLAYSNAQALLDIRTGRNRIIDSSVYGMGRGAGNLNTELFVGYLNENTGSTYKLKPLLGIIDEILNGFYQGNYWGYSLPNYLSAVHNTHPNYALYLDEKKSCTVEDMDEIFSMMQQDKRVEFDKDYIEDLYIRYMEAGDINEDNYANIKEKISGKKVLLIAPGKSAFEEREKVQKYYNDEDVVSISINFEYPYVKTDFVFISNLRRFRELGRTDRNRYIITSNISATDVYLRVKYRKLLNDSEMVKDRAGLMAIRFLIDLGAKEIILVGYDGYSHYAPENYLESDMMVVMSEYTTDNLNREMQQVIREYQKEVKITFLTEPHYIRT